MTAGFLRQCRDERRARPRVTVTLALTRNSVAIGSIALMAADSGLVRGPGEAEMGYVLRADACGHGYAAEAAAAVLELARNACGLTRVLATCRPENHASVRVLKKIGMHPIDYLRVHKLTDGAGLGGGRELESRSMPRTQRRKSWCTPALALGCRLTRVLTERHGPTKHHGADRAPNLRVGRRLAPGPRVPRRHLSSGIEPVIATRAMKGSATRIFRGAPVPGARP